MLQHRLATPVIQPRMRFFDKEGKPLVGGKVYAFKVGTDEFKPTYRNSEFTALNQNPIVLDNAGSALIYLRGANQLRIYDKDGNHIENRIEYQQLERAQFYDDYGKPLKKGFIYTYDYQSTIKKTSYSIDDVTNPNPIVLDEKGTALVNIVGAYRLRQYNSKNIFVGDQDFKRPPIKALTSIVYPCFFDEKISTFVNLNDVIKKQSPVVTENLKSQVQLLNISYREIVNNYQMQPEHIQSSFSMHNMTFLDVTDKYLKTSPQIEKINSKLSLTDFRIVKEIRYISNIMEREKISSSFNCVGIINLTE